MVAAISRDAGMASPLLSHTYDSINGSWRQILALSRGRFHGWQRHFPQADNSFPIQPLTQRIGDFS